MAKQPRSRSETNRDKQAAERRQQLLAAAKSLFAEKGYHATSTRMISQKIGMADGLLYHYFPDGKMEMLQTVVREGHELRVNQIDESWFHLQDDPNVPLRQCLLDFLSAIYRILLSDKELLNIQIRERDLLETSVIQYLSDSVRDRRSHMAKVLERRAALGQIRELDYEVAAVQIMSVNMLFLLKAVAGIDLTDGNGEAFRERMIDSILEGWNYTGPSFG